VPGKRAAVRGRSEGQRDSKCIFLSRTQLGSRRRCYSGRRPQHFGKRNWGQATLRRSTPGTAWSMFVRKQLRAQEPEVQQ
ncbi:unnamed protein product, partial [Pylaiella littoralis]